MKKLLPLILIIFATPCFGESYLCIGDMATGFTAEDDFIQTEFNSEKYIVKPDSGKDLFESNKTKIYSVHIHGGNFIVSCLRENQVGKAPELLLCGSRAVGFILNKKTMRFAIHEYGSALQSKETIKKDGASSIFIEIGKCSKI